MFVRLRFGDDRPPEAAELEDTARQASDAKRQHRLAGRDPLRVPLEVGQERPVLAAGRLQRLAKYHPATIIPAKNRITITSHLFSPSRFGFGGRSSYTIGALLGFGEKVTLGGVDERFVGVGSLRAPFG